MKKYILFILTLIFAFSQTGFAQDDDVYFIPKKSKKEKKEKTEHVQVTESDYEYISSGSSEYDNWAEHRTNGSRDVDEYNRRKPSNKSYSNDNEKDESYNADESANGTYTERIVRFHSPRVGVYVSSPFYIDYFDVWYDPWYYDPWFGSYTYIGWHGWGPSFYWSNSWYWRNPWYDPWGPCYGWYYPHYYPSYHYRPIPNGAHRGPHGGYVYYGHRNNTSGGRYSSIHHRYNNSGISGRPSRNYGSRPSYRPSREYGNSSSRRPSREYNKSNSRPSRSFGNSSGESPSRSYQSSPSRSYNSTPSRSYNRSFNSGHSGSGRSFGGGHSGRSFGGRR